MLDIQKYIERNNQFIRCLIVVDIQKCLKKNKKKIFECQQVMVQVCLYLGKDNFGKKKGFGGKKVKQEKNNC